MIEIETCKQNAAEQILGDSSLTDDLDDAEANRLIQWALEVSGKVCEESARQTEAEAADYLEETLYQLRRTVRRINRLAGTAITEDSESIIKRLNKIFEGCEKIPGLAVHSPLNPENTARLMQTLPAGDTLEIILSYFDLGGEELNGKEEE